VLFLEKIVSAPVIGVTLALALIGAGAAVAPLGARQAEDPAGFSTSIESRAAAAIESDARAVGGYEARYRLDAQVLLPLWVTSVPLISRRDVGYAISAYHDYQSDDVGILRSYELFVASRPEQARGLDRTGIIREAVSLGSNGVNWTAYFGTMNVSPEGTLADARKALEAKSSLVFDVIDGSATPGEARSTVFTVALDRRRSDAAGLYAALREALDERSPSYTNSVTAGGTRPLPAIAFLGALQASLARLARDGGVVPSGPERRLPFVHNGSVRYLEFLDAVSVAPRKQASWAAKFVRRPERVFRIEYRIINPGDRDGAFTLWAELPEAPSAEMLPVPPLAWELRPRSFLKLRFERIE
jgi:hypothetical protein